MSNLIRLRSELVSMGANFMQSLRESEFSAAIKHRSAIPGGTCEFDLPDYSFWLSRPAEQRMATFEEWMKVVRPLCDGVLEILWVTRQNARPREEIAPAGQYQINFERENPIQLLLNPAAVKLGSVSRDQRQPLPLQPAVHELERAEPARRAIRAGCPFRSDFMHLKRARVAGHCQMSDLRPTRAVVRIFSIPAVLQRSLPPDRSRCLAERGTRHRR